MSNPSEPHQEGILEKAAKTVTALGSTTAAAAGVHNPTIHGNAGQTGKPARNNAVIYNGAKSVKVGDIGYPKMQDPQGRLISLYNVFTYIITTHSTIQHIY